MRQSFDELKWNEKQKQKERISKTTNKQNTRTHTPRKQKRLILTFETLFIFIRRNCFTWKTIFSLILLLVLLFQHFLFLSIFMHSLYDLLLASDRFRVSVKNSFCFNCMHAEQYIRSAERCLTVKTWYICVYVCILTQNTCGKEKINNSRYAHPPSPSQTKIRHTTLYRKEPDRIFSVSFFIIFRDSNALDLCVQVLLLFFSLALSLFYSELKRICQMSECANCGDRWLWNYNKCIACFDLYEIRRKKERINRTVA